jgi:hypothetical protein
MTALALAACISHAGNTGGDAGVDDGASTAVEAGDDAGPSEGGSDATVSVTRYVRGMSEAYWFTDDNGQTAGPTPNTLYVPASAHVHFVLSSDPTEEMHMFQIVIPGYGSPNFAMPAPPTAPATYDWIAPSTRATYSQGIVCSTHHGHVADVVVQ